MTLRSIAAAASVIAIATLFASPASAARCPENVFVNGRCVPSKMLRQLERSYGTRSQAGRYWYDRRSGLFGYIGQPPLAQIAPNLPFPGRLHRKASNGHTGVLINGRELHATEVAFLRRHGPVVPGSYWMDAAGNVGYAGSPRAFANLGAVLRRSNNRGRRGGGGYFSNGLTNSYAGSSNGCSYVSTDSGSVMTGNCN